MFASSPPVGYKVLCMCVIVCATIRRRGTTTMGLGEPVGTPAVCCVLMLYVCILKDTVTSVTHHR